MRLRGLLKRTTAAVAAGALMLMMVPVSAFAADGIAINETNFPDEQFRKYVLEQIDTNKNKTLDQGEIYSTTTIDVQYKGIKSLKGIEYFTSLQELKSQYNSLGVLDLSKNPGLSRLLCPSSGITELKLPSSVYYLECQYNSLTELKLPSSVTYLNCQNNSLTALDVSGCTGLTTLSCQDNPLTALNVSKNRSLNKLYVSGTDLGTLSELDLSSNTELSDVDIRNTNLTSLDVSKNTKLTRLYCMLNKSLTSLKLGTQPNLTTLSCTDDSQLTSLDLSGCSALQDVTAARCALTELNVGNNASLKQLQCYSNQLKSLDVSGSPNLTILEVYNNPLTELKLNSAAVVTDRKITYKNQNKNEDILILGKGNTLDLNTLEYKPELSKLSNWQNAVMGEDGHTLTVTDPTKEVTASYDAGSANSKITYVLKVHAHTLAYKYDDNGHWQECTNKNCPDKSGSRTEKENHEYTDVKDADCNVCGYERTLYTVTPEKAKAVLEGETEPLDAPVAAGAKVNLTAEPAEKGQKHTGWKVYNADTNTEVTDLTGLLTKNDDGTAVLTVPDYNVKVEPEYILYNEHIVTVVDGTISKVDDVQMPLNTVRASVKPSTEEETHTVTVTAAEKTGYRFTGWTAVNIELSEEQQTAPELTIYMPDSDVSFTAQYEEIAVEPEQPVVTEDGSGDVGEAIAAVAIGGAAVWGGYEIATRVILKNLLPEGAAIPANRGQLAVLVWSNAGKPEPAAEPAFADVADAEAAKAAQWCVEQGLMDAKSEGTFEPDGWMPKFKTIEVWNKAFPQS